MSITTIEETTISQESLQFHLLEQEKVNSIIKKVSTGEISPNYLNFCNGTNDLNLISNLEFSMYRIGQAVPIEISIDNLLTDDPIVTVMTGRKRLTAIENLRKAGKLWFEPKIVLHSPQSNPEDNVSATLAEYYAATNYIRSNDSLMQRAVFGARYLYSDIEAMGKKNQTNRQKTEKSINAGKEVSKMVNANPHAIRYCRTMMAVSPWYYDFIAGDNITASEGKMFHNLPTDEDRIDFTIMLMDVVEEAEKKKVKQANLEAKKDRLNAKQAELKAKQAKLANSDAVEEDSTDEESSEENPDEEIVDNETVDYTIAIKSKSYFTIAYKKFLQKIKDDAEDYEAKLKRENKEKEDAKKSLNRVNFDPKTIVKEATDEVNAEIAAESKQDFILESNLPIPDHIIKQITRIFNSELKRAVHFRVKTDMEEAA